MVFISGRSSRAVFAVLALASLGPASPAAAQQALPTIAAKTQGMTRIDGFLPLYWDQGAGKLWLEIDKLGQEMLYVVSLPNGIGSNDIGLDRGQIGGERIVRFDRVGPRVLMIQPNYEFRASSDNPAEVRAVEQSFAQSVLWGFKVESSDPAGDLPARPLALRGVPGADQGLSQEHRDRGDPHLHRRQPGAVGP